MGHRARIGSLTFGGAGQQSAFCTLKIGGVVEGVERSLIPPHANGIFNTVVIARAVTLSASTAVTFNCTNIATGGTLADRSELQLLKVGALH